MVNDYAQRANAAAGANLVSSIVETNVQPVIRRVWYSKQVTTDWPANEEDSVPEEKHGNRHDRRAERAKQRKLLKQVKRMQARMKADKPGI